MSKAVDRLRRFYEPNLRPGEEIRQALEATAAGTGSKIAYGGLIGALAGWLYSMTLEAALLPAFVTGALAGEIVGYLIARKAARTTAGPGAIHLLLVLTDKRLMSFTRFAPRRRRILREYPLGEIAGVIKKRYPVGHYHLVEITTAGGTKTGFVVEGALDLPVNGVTGSG